MKHTKIFPVITLTALLSVSLYGQDETHPDPPLLEFVTVDPETGWSVLDWQPSGSPDVAYYYISSYIDGLDFVASDTVWSPFITEYTDAMSLARYKSVTYVVTAMDSAGNPSELSNPLSTIFTSVSNDSCKHRIELAWTRYVNSLHPGDTYEVWMSAGGLPSALYETIPLTDTAYYFEDYDPSTRYCFHIKVSEGSSGISSSNMQCIISGSEMAPSWVRTDAISVEGRSILVKGSYDQSTDMLSFITERYRPEPPGWVLAGTETGLGGTVTIRVTDTDTSVISLYRITALNNCGREAKSSLPARNIVLTSSAEGTHFDLRWNNPLPAGDAYFSVWRDIGRGWEEVAAHLSDTIWSEEYSLFASDVSSGSVAYQVTAVDPEASAGAPPFRSNISLLPANENIFMPNAFTPGEPGLSGINDIFRPVLSFTPAEYDLRIYSRNGALLFQSAHLDTGWDGRHDGKIMSSGVYLWSLRLVMPSGNSEQRTGTVTLLP